MNAPAVDLDVLGRAITGPDEQARAAARERLEELGLRAPYGRLADLALWWSAVRGDDRAGSPTRVRHAGTADLPWPSADEAADVTAALAWGVSTADALADAGVDLLLVTLDDHVAARLVAAELMGLDPVEALGWQEDRAGIDHLDDEAWMDEVVALRDGLRRTAGLRGEPTVLLGAVGSTAVAAAAALVVQATARRTPVLLDGSGAGAAALLARRTAYVAADWWQAGQGEADPLHGRILRSLQLEPLTNFGVQAEDGTGARLGLPVVRLAADLLAR